MYLWEAVIHRARVSEGTERGRMGELRLGRWRRLVGRVKKMMG